MPKRSAHWRCNSAFQSQERQLLLPPASQRIKSLSSRAKRGRCGSAHHVRMGGKFGRIIGVAQIEIALVMEDVIDAYGPTQRIARKIMQIDLLRLLIGRSCRPVPCSLSPMTGYAGAQELLRPRLTGGCGRLRVKSCGWRPPATETDCGATDAVIARQSAASFLGPSVGTTSNSH